MRLIALADIHGSLTYLNAVAEPLRGADAVVIAGDITTFGSAQAARPIIEALEALNPRIVAVHGNCDQDGVIEYLDHRDMGVHGRTLQVGDLTFVGVGGALACSGRTPNEVDDALLGAGLDSGRTGPDPDSGPLVLVTHQPPYDTALDRTGTSGHCGSHAIREFIDRYHPVLAVSGHLHESVGIDRLGPTTLVNPGPFKQGCYALIEVAAGCVTVDLAEA